MQDLGLGVETVVMRGGGISFSSRPATMKEWLGFSLGLLAIVGVFAVVATGPAGRGVVAFWFLEGGFLCSVLIYLTRRLLLLRRGQAALYARIDKILVALIDMFGLAAILALLLKL